MHEKAAEITAPGGDGTNNTSVIAFTLDTTARNVALPRDFYGQFVRLLAVGANAYWYFSKSNSAAVDRTVAASATGARAANLGEYLPNTTIDHEICPNALPTETVYLVWQGDAAGTVLQLRKSSGKPLNAAEGG
jgi:hypothetical protein